MHEFALLAEQLVSQVEILNESLLPLVLEIFQATPQF